MDLNSKNFWLGLQVACLLTTAGCVAPQTPVPTFWQKLGIPQAGARLRDGLVNRRGNFPGLEKKPPVLALADPANLDPAKPDMIKAAAEIKQDQDLKKQKIKAIKFLAEVNCGCYNKDDKVEAAFLAALEDCDPDVRTAAIEGLDKAAGECTRCRNGCVITCCTKKIMDKLNDLATGVEDGCYKEPVEEIRDAARALYCKCPPIPAEPIVPEELIAPDPNPVRESPRESEAELIEAETSAYNMSDLIYGEYDSPPVVVGATHLTSQSNLPPTFSLNDSADNALTGGRIANPEQLVKARTIAYRKTLGEILIQMPDAFDMRSEWVAIVVDRNDNHSLATIVDVGGRRVLLAIDKPWEVDFAAGETMRIGLVSK